MALSADADRNQVARQAEGILVVVVVADVQHAVALQAIPFGGQSVPFMGSRVQYQVHYLLASEDTYVLQVPHRREYPPPRRRFLRGLTVMHCERQTLVFHPYTRKGQKIRFKSAFPLPDAAARLSADHAHFRTVIPDDAR